MILPRKMKLVELTALEKDIDAVVEYLGRRSLMQFTEQYEEQAVINDERLESPEKLEEFQQLEENEKKKANDIEEKLEEIRKAAAYLGLELPSEPYATSRLPTADDEVLREKICSSALGLCAREAEEKNEKQKLENALTEAKAFAVLNAPFSELDQLSYLTLRVGRLDMRGQVEVKRSLSDRAAIIPLDDDKILAASSRIGRFALDSELKKRSFTPIAIPKDYLGIPVELLASLEARQKLTESNMDAIAEEKNKLLGEYRLPLLSLSASYTMSNITEQVKQKLVTTKSTYLLTGWMPADSLDSIASELVKITSGRIGIRTLNPDEVPSVRDGSEKVPTALSHGKFAKSFEPLVFSYGAPLYGAIDPTLFVAVFFTLLFGVMFGDVGQGLVLLLVGLLLMQKDSKFTRGYKNFGGPLVAVGISSMSMGLLYGAVFSNETILEAPTLAVTGFFANTPVGVYFGWSAVPKILRLMPEKGSLDKLFYFFGFTLALGVILNSTGLIFNIINQFIKKNYEKALFSKTGIAGALFFWHAIGIAVRLILNDRLHWFDVPCLAIPLLGIFFGDALGRLISGEHPILKEGLMVFIIEGIVEILETLSSYISNSVSFLRVGAFALSHAVLSFITFTMADIVARSSSFGPVFSLAVIIFGNGIIIVLEGMIVAIQVTRLQYYEFFSKFFTETGVRFAPFRFRKE
ncbi:MAG: V-type ATP synthase subunit I [Treponema sp.]|jgi:V/A-type H+-transporting ATPase subunit I|nr:V-type ATP synthase subunit I [Treponema sp.]